MLDKGIIIIIIIHSQPEKRGGAERRGKIDRCNKLYYIHSHSKTKWEGLKGEAAINEDAVFTLHVLSGYECVHLS